jgi:hypothetical protein
MSDQGGIMNIQRALGRATAVLLVSVLGLVGGAAFADDMMKKDGESSVKVENQTIDDARVVIAEVDSAGPGWLVIHADLNGKPGAVIGYAAVREGRNENVTVAIDVSRATPVLYAMLHDDKGKIGVYEFPGADVPTMSGGMMVSPAFKAAPQAY